jgi:integrase
MGIGYKVVYATPEFIAQAGFEKVAYLPFIFNSQLAYHRHGSRFLIDRGLGAWDPRNRGADQKLHPPTTKSMKNYADRLANFLEWCEVRSLDPMTIDYKHDLIGRYQKEMLKGIWSRDNKPLSERTINVRIDTAADYLSWMADKALRAPFFVSKITRSVIINNPKSSRGHLPKEVEVREGKLRETEGHLTFPEDQEVAAWLNRLYAKEGSGTTVGLISELILETGIRREEAASWRVDTLPLVKADWRIVNPQSAVENQAVAVTLRYGTKGKEYGRDHGDKIGPSGEILVPLPMALKLHHYLEKVRPKALSVATRKGANLTEQRKIQAESVHLFLKPSTGKRYSGKNIHDAWCSVEHQRGWGPHLGRHYWACTTLWRKLQIHQLFLEEALKAKVSDDVLGSIRSNALSIIRLEIQPQLRHVSEQTTLIYLRWVANRLHINLNLQEQWAEKLAEVGNGEGS